jgi:hypothetical protein
MDPGFALLRAVMKGLSTAFHSMARIDDPNRCPGPAVYRASTLMEIGKNLSARLPSSQASIPEIPYFERMSSRFHSCPPLDAEGLGAFLGGVFSRLQSLLDIGSNAGSVQRTCAGMHGLQPGKIKAARMLLGGFYLYQGQDLNLRPPDNDNTPPSIRREHLHVSTNCYRAKYGVARSRSSCESATSLVRAFKRYQGMTPKAFRAID